MTGELATFSPGLWRLRAEIAQLSGLVPRRALWRAPAASAAIAGWGHKPTADRARAEARRTGLPYLAFEDGFLRSVRPGEREPPAAMILDRSGIYYDARGPSDLERLIESGAVTDAECASAQSLLAEIARHRLSKYNSGSDEAAALKDVPRGPLVLVIDQTAGDASVAGGLATPQSFDHMLAAARAENPGAAIVAKLHPQSISGEKSGYLDRRPLPPGVFCLAAPVNPWLLLDRQPVVYTVSSQFGFEALLAGCKVVCFGAPFYAGWGLTDDRIAIARRSARPAAQALAAAAYLRYSHYFDIWRRTPVSAETAVDQLAFRRRAFFRNAGPVVACGIARWKRKAVAAMLDGPHGPPRFVRSEAQALHRAERSGGAVALWGARALRFRKRHPGTPCLAIEDGFIRSAGLGAAFVPPLSLVFDSRGLYFDPRSPSDLEVMLAEEGFDEPKLQQARALRERLVAERITKYNLDGAPPDAFPQDGRTRILVPGQVADDWAIRLGFPDAARGVNVNEVLLRAVRHGNPEACVIFKPHPDVERLGRSGKLESGDEKRLADCTIHKTSLEQVLGLVDTIETFSSLAGFEGLLRGLPVTTHGLPFYAGWGLTRDHMPAPRRGRRRTPDELVAAALIDYPRYWDPESGLACPPEVVLDRLAALRRKPPSAGQRVAGLAGRAVIAWRRLNVRFEAKDEKC